MAEPIDDFFFDPSYRNLIGATRDGSRGVVVNLEAAVDSIKKAIEEAELTAGVEMEHDQGEFEYNALFFGFPSTTDFTGRTATKVGYYLQDYIELGDRWFTTLGVRWDNHNRYGRAFTYRGATNFLIPETGTTLRASYGTGFLPPHVNQLVPRSLGAFPGSFFVDPVRGGAIPGSGARVRVGGSCDGGDPERPGRWNG